MLLCSLCICFVLYLIPNTSKQRIGNIKENFSQAATAGCVGSGMTALLFWRLAVKEAFDLPCGRVVYEQNTHF